MPRPPCCRRISQKPAVALFAPSGVAAPCRDAVVLSLDEFEALRLADLQNLYQEQAAERMQVSRTTFGRIIDSAHRKVAQALVGGRALRIEGGPVREVVERRFRCRACASEWNGPSDGPSDCPRCRRREPGGIPCCGRGTRSREERTT
jgi:predicted DNA-binding protein (UPF0251 family)